MVETGDTEEAIEAGRRFFAHECNFMLGVASLEQLPDPVINEVAFAGRSNVGKSSLLNALTGRKNLARTSNTPGRQRDRRQNDLLSGNRFLLKLINGNLNWFHWGR